MVRNDTIAAGPRCSNAKRHCDILVFVVASGILELPNLRPLLPLFRLCCEYTGLIFHIFSCVHGSRGNVFYLVLSELEQFSPWEMSLTC